MNASDYSLLSSLQAWQAFQPIRWVLYIEGGYGGSPVEKIESPKTPISVTDFDERKLALKEARFAAEKARDIRDARFLGRNASALIPLPGAAC